MIPRYTRPAMGELWSDESRFARWLDVEIAVLATLEESRKVPRGTAKRIRAGARIDVARVLELERRLKHDVIAFTASIAEQGPASPRGRAQWQDAARFFHYGLTSSDVVDTALSVAFARALEILGEDMARVDRVLERLARRYQGLVAIGRTHGVHAEPTVFGLKFLGWLAEFRRQSERLSGAAERIRVGKLSGAVGCYGVLSPEIERRALARLGLRPESVATQVVPRDRHAEVFCVLAQIGGSVERVATELRHLQRTEVREVEEPFTEGQKGSSAMPHKKNPVASENLTGCARLLRGYAISALENVALWHERDISHSSVERVIAPDATILLDYMLDRLASTLEGIRVLEGNVTRNLGLTRGVYSSGHVLLKLVEKGLSREQAYAIVQEAALSAWESGSALGEELARRRAVNDRLSRGELAAALDMKNFTRHVDAIYARVLGNERKRFKTR